MFLISPITSYGGMGEKAFCKYEEQIPHQQIYVPVHLLMASFCYRKNVAAAKNQRHPWRKRRRRCPPVCKSRWKEATSSTIATTPM